MTYVRWFDEMPAVVNVDNAMRRIADGEEITIDGTAGRVYLDSR